MNLQNRMYSPTVETPTGRDNSHRTSRAPTGQDMLPQLRYILTGRDVLPLRDILPLTNTLPLTRHISIDKNISTLNKEINSHCLDVHTLTKYRAPPTRHPRVSANRVNHMFMCERTVPHSHSGTHEHKLYVVLSPAKHTHWMYMCSHCRDKTEINQSISETYTHCQNTDPQPVRNAPTVEAYIHSRC